MMVPGRFHGKCVGIPEKTAKKLKQYICPVCVSSHKEIGEKQSEVIASLNRMSSADKSKGDEVKKAYTRGRPKRRTADEPEPIVQKRIAPPKKKARKENTPAEPQELPLRRIRCRESLVEAFLESIHASSTSITKDSAITLAAAIETALWEVASDGANKVKTPVPVDYSEQCQSILFSLKDEKNKTLYPNVVNGTCPPRVLCCLTPDELMNENAKSMFSEERQKWKEEHSYDSSYIPENLRLKIIGETVASSLEEKTARVDSPPVEGLRAEQVQSLNAANLRVLGMDNGKGKDATTTSAGKARAKASHNHNHKNEEEEAASDTSSSLELDQLAAPSPQAVAHTRIAPVLYDEDDDDMEAKILANLKEQAMDEEEQAARAARLLSQSQSQRNDWGESGETETVTAPVVPASEQWKQLMSEFDPDRTDNLHVLQRYLKELNQQMQQALH